MERVSILTPFGSRPDAHEDHLSWAFLVALRYEPQLQRYIRDLVEAQLPPSFGPRDSASDWEPASIRTQTRDVSETSSHIVSVLVADSRLERTIAVEWSDRNARYDGVIEYSDGLTLVVENKPSVQDVWDSQLSPSRASFGGDVDAVQLYRKAVALEWPTIMEGLLGFANSRVASYSGSLIALDLLAYLEEARPNLTPYRTYVLCDRRRESLDRRTLGLVRDLGEKTGLEVRARPGRSLPYLIRPGCIAQEWQLFVEEHDGEYRIRQCLWPADTVGQARRFYDEVGRVKFLELPDSGWMIQPNLHFSFMSKHLVWAETALTVEEFLDRFDHLTKYGQTSLDARFADLLEEWIQGGVLRNEDRNEIDRHFTNTKRETINVIPGLHVYRDWDLDQVIALERDGHLEDELISAVSVPLSAWGESLT